MQEGFARFRARYILLDVVLIVFAFGFLLAASFLILKLNEDALPKDPIVIYGIYYAVMLTICFSILRRLKKAGVQSEHLIGNTSFRKLPWLMLLIVFYGIETLEDGLYRLTIFFANLVSPSFVKSELENNASNVIYKTDSLLLGIAAYFFIFLVVAIVAPVIEEFIFRGVLLNRFGAKWGATSAVLVSSFLFDLVHLNLASFSIGVGFIFVALLYMKTRTLMVPIAYHAMSNAIVVVSGIVKMLSHYQGPGEITLNVFWTGLLNTAFAIPILLYFLKWPSRSDLLPYAANVEAQRDRLGSPESSNSDRLAGGNQIDEISQNLQP